MEVRVQPRQKSNRENHPGANRGNEKEAQQTCQNRGNPVDDTHKSICIAKSEQRSRNECCGQNSEDQLDPQWSRDTGVCRRKCPRLIQEEMRQKRTACRMTTKTITPFESFTLHSIPQPGRSL